MLLALLLAVALAPTALSQAPVCGDGQCDLGEDAFECPDDCPASCGDGICSPAEVCAEDCPASCGDGTCDLAEDGWLCPQDCPAGCGDSECVAPEDCTTCATDCCELDDGPVCGDGLCDLASEDSIDCPEDCGESGSTAPPPPVPAAVCGDGLCDLGENPCGCSVDCGPVGDPSACACGDGVCDRAAGEDCVECATDCGGCLPAPGGTCGDGVCEAAVGETCADCAADCGLCPVFDDPTVEQPPTDPEAQSDGLDPAFQKHWSMDLTSEEYAVAILDDPDHEVCTPLADSEGRRDVVYRVVGAGGGLRLNTVADSWNFWAGGIRAPNGTTLVCWNRLVGASSDATVGATPDPRQGVQLVCVLDTGGGFGDEIVVEPGQPAAWLDDFGVGDAGEPTVRYLRDAMGTLINSGKPGDGPYEVVFH